MTSNRKLNANHDEDSFEFVDYSSVSSFERLTAAIEEVLLSWGINNHSYGVLADDALAALTDYSKHTCISFGAENYKLTYYCHPQVISLPVDTSASAHRPLLLDNYYQFEPPSPPTLDASSEPTAAAYHPLHRWTGLGRLIILTPISSSTIGSKLFAPSSKSASIDHSQAKVLLTACALAFNNVRCSVPIFISQSETHQHSKYSGYSLEHHGNRDLEIRFNSKVISPAPRPCPMAFLQASFIEQLNANRVDNGLPPFSPVERLNILKGAVLTYNLRNWFSANWKLWNEDDETDAVKMIHKKTSSLPLLSFGSYNDPLRTMTLSAIFPLGMDRPNHHLHHHHHHHHHHHFQHQLNHHQQEYEHHHHLDHDHHHQQNHDHHHQQNHDHHHQQNHDHHHHLDLDQHRQQSYDHYHYLDRDQHRHQDHGRHHHHTHDSISHNNLDALSATYWDLTLEFAPSSQKRALLSTLLENTISSWITYSSSNRHSLGPHTNTTITGDDESMGRRHSTRLMQNILHAIGQNKGDDGSTTKNHSSCSIKSAEVDAIVTSLFKSNTNGADDDGRTHGNNSSRGNNNNNRRRNTMDNIRLRDANADLSIPTPRSLGTRLKFGTSVPWRSFLWNFVVYQMDALQKLDIGSHTASAQSTAGMDLLRICWPKILRQFRWHWENLIPIPNVNPFIYHHHTDSQDGSNLGVDLGYSIVHQKLAMINCCIHQSIKELPTDDHTSPPLASKHKNSSLLFKDLHHDIRTIHSSNDDDPLEERYSSLSIGTKNDQSMPCTTHSDISESYLYDSMDNDDINGTTTTTATTTTTTTATTATSIDQRTTKSSKLDTVNKCQQTFAQSSSSWSSSISDVSDLVRPASTSSIQESFVGLNYSTSAESDPCQHVPSHLSETDDWSTSISKSTPELQDPNAFEGRYHQHESILLLKTKTPLWVPVTQNSGFMTEDMIQQQSDAFESLGTSDDATQLRAKLQSAQLESDMQAFKAANPHAVLGDFVKWYSPKDWVEDDDDDPSKGKLSARMSHPTNIWQELWKCSRRIPASRQPSLFNLTAEGEKALHYLEHLPVHELFSLLLPTMCLVMYDVLASHPIVKYIRPVALGLNDFANELVNFPWDALRIGAIEFGSITSIIKQEETLMCNAISMLRKIPKQYDLVERLLVDSRVRLKDDGEQAAIFNLYKTEGDTMPKPACIEYVFYMNCSPSIDHPLPQRQYILLKDNKLRQLDMCSIGHHH